MKVVAAVGLALSVMACEPSKAPPAEASAGPAATAPQSSATNPSPQASTLPTASASIAARALPAIDDQCTKDAGCTYEATQFVDDEHFLACCPNCTFRAVNRTSLTAFRAACERQPARMCPPIGCAMEEKHAVCTQNRCVLVKG